MLKSCVTRGCTLPSSSPNVSEEDICSKIWCNVSNARCSKEHWGHKLGEKLQVESVGKINVSFFSVVFRLSL